MTAQQSQQWKRFRIGLAASVLAALTWPTPAATLDNKSDLEDFIHYTIVAKPDLAKAHLRQLLDSGISDADLVVLIESLGDMPRFEEALSKGRYVRDTSDIVAELETRVREGRKALARDQARIRQAIADLSGTLRGQRMAEEILLEAGEYAVPELLKVVTDGTDPSLRMKCVDLLERIGWRAVSPLCAALPHLDPGSQERVCSILSRIGHASAAPYLADIAANDATAPSARQAAAQAHSRLDATGGSVSDEYAALARMYFTNARSLTAYPAESTNNVWSYDSFVGLVPTAVPTEIFGDVMAMRVSRTSLQHNSSNDPALTTYIAANLKRENNLPQGATDPVYGASAYSPEFYAMAAGPTVMQDVLAVSLDTQDTVLIRDAIHALESTAGDANLFGGGRQPLQEALQYPDRRVRYDAALALGQALPMQSFTGDFSVVPVLGAAVRAGDATFALVIADDPEDQNNYTQWLESSGYTVVGRGRAMNEVQGEIGQAAGIDLVVVRQSAGNAQQTVREVRGTSKSSVAPVVIMTTQVESPELNRAFEGDARTTVKVERGDPAAFAAIVDEAMMKGSGGKLTEADAMAYTFEAIGTLLDIAISNSPVYDIRDAEPALVSALSTREGNIRHHISDVLAHIATPGAQQAIFDAALAAESRDQIELLRRVADSARMNGNLVEERHISALLSLVKQGGEVGEAAARVHGAFDLGTDQVVKIISD